MRNDFSNVSDQRPAGAVNSGGAEAPTGRRSNRLELRYYQQAAVDAVYDYLRRENGNPCVVLPTGSGKTPLLATICRDVVIRWNGRVLVLAHVKELLQQAADKLQLICPEVKVGVYSAGLRSRETDASVIVAGIHPCTKKPANWIAST